jgi:hypothetical protein
MAYQSVSLNDFVSGQPKVDQNFLDVIDLLPTLGGRKGPWIAGGSVRKFMNDVPNLADYDVFFSSQEQCTQFCEDLVLAGATEQQRNIFNSQYLLNGYVIQCVHHEFRSTLIQTMDRFDMTICQYGFDGTNLWWSAQAFEDVKDKVIRFLDTTDPVYNINRAFKYATEGFKPADGEVKKVLNRVAQGKASVKNSRKISGGGANNTVTVELSDDFLPAGGSVFVGPSPTPRRSVRQSGPSLQQIPKPTYPPADKASPATYLVNDKGDFFMMNMID